MNHPLRIAVADDEPDMRDYFRKVLPRLGHEVVSVAGTGRELVEQCRALHPDVIITDVRMPELDGLDAVAEINREGAVPVILLSAYQDGGLAERPAAEHVVAYLVKPVKQSDLVPALALARQRFEQSEASRRG
jgi:two-component system, response regulator PdtaR